MYEPAEVDCGRLVSALLEELHAAAEAERDDEMAR